MPTSSAFGFHLLVVRNCRPCFSMAGDAEMAICTTSNPTTLMHTIAITSVSLRNAQSAPYSIGVGGCEMLAGLSIEFITRSDGECRPTKLSHPLRCDDNLTHSLPCLE